MLHILPGCSGFQQSCDVQEVGPILSICLLGKIEVNDTGNCMFDGHERIFFDGKNVG